VPLKSENDVDYWEEELEDMISSGEYDYCEDFLQDVLNSIKYSGVITDRQISALENIQNG